MLGRRSPNRRTTELPLPPNYLRNFDRLHSTHFANTSRVAESLLASDRLLGLGAAESVLGSNRSLGLEAAESLLGSNQSLENSRIADTVRQWDRLNSIYDTTARISNAINFSGVSAQKLDPITTATLQCKIDAHSLAGSIGSSLSGAIVEESLLDKFLASSLQSTITADARLAASIGLEDRLGLLRTDERLQAAISNLGLARSEFLDNGIETIRNLDWQLDKLSIASARSAIAELRGRSPFENSVWESTLPKFLGQYFENAIHALEDGDSYHTGISTDELQEIRDEFEQVVAAGQESIQSSLDKSLELLEDGRKQAVALFVLGLILNLLIAFHFSSSEVTTDSKKDIQSHRDEIPSNRRTARQEIKEIQRLIKSEYPTASLRDFRVVSTSALIVYVDSGTKYASTDALFLGTIVKVIQREKAWTLVEYENGAEPAIGWVFSRHLKRLKN